MTETRSITTKDATKLLRARLKVLFPATKFSVRFESYSMGSHINVSWTDGPAQRTVEAVANAYSSTRYDGYDDSTNYVKSWLLSDGSAVLASGDAPSADAELVHFHGSAPSCNRTVSPTYEAACSKAWAGLSADYKFALVSQDRFPQWEGHTDGYKLAWFFDAGQILGA